jgi:Kelch motif
MRVTILALLFWELAAAQSPGMFTQTGTLTVPREFHTATLLPDGKVLMTGGFSYGNGPFSTWTSAEVYDPSNGSFTATGHMTAARHMHTATLLPNGKVLIAGGRYDNGGPQLASAELYDPATGTFSTTGSMTIPRSGHVAPLLNSGKVLIVGNSSGASAELYDPSTGTFTPTGNMTEPGADTATLLPNGKVLITRSTESFVENHADLYDPVTGTFARTGDLIDATLPGKYPLAIPGQNPSAILLTNGKVLVAGGAQGDFISSSAEIYDPATGTFSVTGKLTAAIGYWQAAALLPEGRVLIAGESDGVPCGVTHIGPPITDTCSGAAQLYDPVTGTFSDAFESLAQEGHAATLLPDGTVLLSGGFRCCGITIAGAELYHPAVLVASPALFSLPSGGNRQGAILHAGTARVVSSSDPAVAGEAVEIYGAGLIDGSVIPPQVAIGGSLAEVLYFGKAPGFAGWNQINVRMPAGVASGPTVPVRLNYLGRPSNEVTIGVR